MSAERSAGKPSLARDEKAKAPQAGEARKEDLAAAPRKKRSRKTLIVAISVASALLIAGGGAASWFLGGRPAAKHADGKDARAPAATEKPRPALFVPLDTFTVNLQQEDGERFLQTTLTLKVADNEVEQSVKQQMPEIRSRLLLLLSSKKASELASVEGKQALANQIAGEVNAALTGGAAKPAPAAGAAKAPVQRAEPQVPVLSVLFTNFIIQ